MDAVPGFRGAPRAVCQYVKGHGARGSERQLEVLYLAHGEDNQDVRNFFRHL